MKKISTQNNFEVLSILEEQMPLTLEEGEIPQSQDQSWEENKEISETNQGSPAASLSPTYVEMAKKRNQWLILVHLMKNLLRGPKKKDADHTRQ